MSRYTSDDILRVLNHSEWKRGLQIRDELVELKEDKVGKPNIQWLYDTLGKLKGEGYIEHREGTDKAILAQRDGYGYSEFRLTQDGMRVRIDITERD